jgi:hypothetical protein
MQGQATAARPAASPGYRETIFYAVLEGLYDEGVGNDDVDILLREDPATKLPMHFVYGCPLCNPAIDALRLYRGRPKFHGLKGDPDTFGPGLPAPEREALRNTDILVRLRVLHDLVERSLQRKLSSMRLTKDERTAWHLALAEMRDKGGKLLEQAREQGAAGALGAAKGCAVCDGMRDAGTWMIR